VCASTMSIYDQPAEDLKEPWPDAGAIAERGKRLHRLQICLLREVFGGGDVTNQPHGESVDRPQMQQRHILEALPVSRLTILGWRLRWLRY